MTSVSCRIIIIVVMIAVMKVKGAIGDPSQSVHCSASCLQHVRSSDQGVMMCTSHANTSGACHVQHVCYIV